MQVDLDSREMARRSEAVRQLEEEKSTFKKSVEITEKAIISRGKELKDFVDQCTWSLLEELTSINNDGLKAMECETDEYDSYIFAYDRSGTNRTDFRSTVGTGSLPDGIGQMQQLSKTLMQQTIPSIRISFEISKLEKFLKRDNIVGKIKREEKRVAVVTANGEFGFHSGWMKDEEQKVTSSATENTETEDAENNSTGNTIEPDCKTADDEATTEETAFEEDETEMKETTLTAEEDEEPVEDKKVIFDSKKVETTFHEKKTMSRKKETKAKTPTKKRPGRNKTGLENVSKLPLLCATYTYRDQQSPGLSTRKSHSISLVKTLDFPRVWGVTKLEDNIYVLGWMPNSIRVFEDKYPFHLQDEIQIEEIQSPEDIASNDKTKCLYVTDLRNKSIWEITKRDQVAQWLSNVDWPFTLSVTSEGHLLLLRDTLNGQSSKLDIYGSNAKLIKSLSLPCDIQRPLHAIQKPNGQFIVVHRLMNRETGQWVISQLTTDGQLTGQFIPKTEFLDWPFHLAFDSEDDRLFVADYWNHRVIRCDSLNWSQTILKETIYRPLRLYFDDKKKQLIVVNAGRVDIYFER